MAQGRPASLCPLDVKSTRTSGDMKDTSIQEEEAAPGSGQVGLSWDVVAMETCECSDAELGQLDMDLDRKSKQHNLTSRNVRAILHEVITHEHVVAMMKAAIRDTQDLPMFEPKMTRSRLKQAVQQEQRLNWTLSALNTVKPPQFVDINLEEDEDSSDEEYCPDEEEEEDTAEEMFLSDADSLASPPRIHLCSAPDQKTRDTLESVAGQVTHQVRSASDAGSSESSFLERLNAVEEELNCSSAYTYNQPLDRKPVADDDGNEGCLAFRTRSKLPLVNVPLDRLEAELLPPDITADMYDQSSTQLEDRHWTKWLQGLMAPGPEDEADDDDDPEYNFLEDLDEPDLEDYRTDRAVQITKKEVNELLEELFETLQEEELPAEEEEQEAPSVTAPKFNVPQVLHFEAPLAGMLTERRQTVRKQYEAMQQRRALQDTTNHLRNTKDSSCPPHAVALLGGQTGPAPHTGPILYLVPAQKLQLQQQVQQHVQLLTQVHLLSHRVHALNHEAHLTKRYLEELQQFAGHHDDLGLPSSFRACNLQGALDLLREVEQRERAPPSGSGSGASRRLLPAMTATTHSHAFPLLPADAAWLFATRPVFLYPELLPVCSLDPALHSRHQRRPYTPGEDGLMVLGLKHFQGALQSDQLISSYLLCRSRSDIRKRIREMSGPRAPRDGMIKVFVSRGVVPPLPVACSRVCPEERRPPVNRDPSHMPRWLKNSQTIIQRTRRDGGPYPPSLPPGCALRLHPSYVRKYPAPRRVHRRLFTLAHNASLPPLAKAPAEQPIGRQPTAIGALPLAAAHPGPTHSVAQDIQQAPIIPCSAAPQQPGVILLQMLWTPPPSSQHAAGPESPRPIRRQDPERRPPGEDEAKVEDSSSSTLSPLSSSTGEKEEEEGWSEMVVGLRGGGGGRGAVEGGQQEKTPEGGGQEEPDGDGEEEEEDGGREGRGGEREDDGDKDRRGDEEEDEEDDEEEEEEDFDDLTQDEDEEEVMSSASEESVLSVPELQETMKQLTWLAAERRLCDGDSEDEPSSPEDEDDEDDEAKGEEPGEGRSFTTSPDKETPSGAKTPRGRRGSGRGRGRSRPLRGLARTRQERLSKDASKLSLLYDENLLDNDPLRDSKDAAFAQSYLNRVREALQGSPDQVQDFVSLLNKFEQVGDGQEVTRLFRKLRCILGEHTDLLRDFAAFLLPEQALLCGLFEEQQAFERSRRFLRQLEISFGDNPSHYQKIIKALQTGPDLSPSNIQELKAQMATLLKGHTHLQAEFWVFFDDLRPPMARPEQFEEAHLPEEGEGGEGGDQVSGGGASGGFEEVTLPDLEEEEEGHKIRPITSRRRQRRKMESHRSYKGSDWFCLCHDAKISRHRRKQCSRCHGNKTSAGVSRALKSLDPLYSQMTPDPPGDRTLDMKGGHSSPHPDQSGASWESSFLITDEKEEEEEQLNDEEQESPTVKRRREEELQLPAVCSSVTSDTSSTFITSVSSSSVATLISGSSSSAPPRPSPPDPPVCAKNISLTASGEKVILWTREADRVILTMCQQEGANQHTFQAISNLLGNKTPSEVSQRFRDLMRLFRTAARHAAVEDEAPPTDPTADEAAD